MLHDAPASALTPAEEACWTNSPHCSTARGPVEPALGPRRAHAVVRRVLRAAVRRHGAAHGGAHRARRRRPRTSCRTPSCASTPAGTGSRTRRRTCGVPWSTRAGRRNGGEARAYGRPDGIRGCRGRPEPDELFDVLARLPYRQRVALVLQYYEGLSNARSRRCSDCREGTVASLVHRALVQLRRMIEL